MSLSLPHNVVQVSEPDVLYEEHSGLFVISQCQAVEALHQITVNSVIGSVMSLLRKAISVGPANGPCRKLHSVFLKSP